MLEKEDIRLFVDGQQRGRFTYDPQSGKLVFDKMERLGAGKKHSARIVATDEAGNTATERWSFTIR